MLRRMVIGLSLVACLTVPAAAAPGGGSRAGGAATAATRARKAPAPAKRPAAHAARATAGARRDSTARAAGAPRRLEDIHIEGEIPAPQVLFVTARDQRRFTRFHHQRYLKTSVQVGETTRLPTRIALTSHPPTAAGAP